MWTLQFEYNAARQSKTKHATFEIELGYIPPTPITCHVDYRTVRLQEPSNLVVHRNDLQPLVQDHLTDAIARQKYYTDQHRKEVAFIKHDIVWLNVESHSISRRAILLKKLQPRVFASHTKCTWTCDVLH